MKKFNLLNSYKERYYISPIDLADSAETNRLVLITISPFLFLFGVLDIAVIVTIHYSHLSDYIISLIYFSIFTLVSIYLFTYSRKVKNIDREKAYIWKTIPFYMLFHTVQLASVYNFYILGQPFNGFVTFCLTGFISLCVFSFSPIPFLIGLIIPISLMAPGIYKEFGTTGLADAILTTVVMFCLSLYKRRIEKKHITLLKKQKKNLMAKTFGNFTLLYENKVVKFSRSKSNELMGYLIYKQGSSVNTKELISILWGDSADSARYGSSLRNLIVDIKHTIKELEIESFFMPEYNSFRINPEVIECDYYDFLAGKQSAVDSFAGEFMSQYSWAEETTAFLAQKVLK